MQKILIENVCFGLCLKAILKRERALRLQHFVRLRKKLGLKVRLINH